MKKIFLVLLLYPLLSSSQIQNTFSKDIVVVNYKEKVLSDSIGKFWQHKDIFFDTLPGSSIDKAYQELWLSPKDSIIIAIIDSGVDINHEELQGHFWTNNNEVPGNHLDDDKNGYIDDIHGWNFLGNSKGKSISYARKEFIRILCDKGYFKNGKIKDGDSIGKKAEKIFKEQIKTLDEDWEYVIGIENDYKRIGKDLKEYFPNKNYSLEKIKKIDTIANPNLAFSVKKLDYYLTYEATLDWMVDFKKYLKALKKFKLNPDFDDRKEIGDDINDLFDKSYGNGDITPVDETEIHATAVAGLIAAKRNNKKGGNGVINNVKLMMIRAVPSGDEYDKDIALAIRYAVDNGAKIINMSFGKLFSMQPEFVKEAIKYASKHDVLLVHGAGNDNLNIDQHNFYPLDYSTSKNEITDNFINVGALNYKMNHKFPAYFSNYGKLNVDIFAPGYELHTTIPENSYITESGTSFAAPIVTGIAAMVRLKYPLLSAKQVKQIIIESGNKYHLQVRIPGKTKSPRVPFSELSKSGKVVNAYNALLMAEQISKSKN
ncbi:S8 family serine peptidase [Aquimarina algiphila]|uniref:S8 family serine peptidase n=1 Tax=Aquimarina algiphila TaxID=2047982 RepID=A0A554VBB0_9FLAO|nr:S8 family serine peptidase [Aquimarina algiphila]TSE03743.1 S8 family serine peptidase [Aquimarina algiphila]